MAVLNEGGSEARVASGPRACPCKRQRIVGTGTDFRGLKNSVKIEVAVFVRLPKPDS